MKEKGKKEESTGLEKVSENDGFNQSSVNTVVENTDELFLVKCPSCKGVHFRHAGYVLPMLPYISPVKRTEVKASTEQVPVQVCVKCRTCIICYEGKVQNVTDHIDLKAWEKFEKVAHKATGPGGQC